MAPSKAAVILVLLVAASLQSSGYADSGRHLFQKLSALAYLKNPTTTTPKPATIILIPTSTPTDTVIDTPANIVADTPTDTPIDTPLDTPIDTLVEDDIVDTSVDGDGDDYAAVGPPDSDDIFGGAVDPAESDDTFGSAVDPADSDNIFGAAVGPADSDDIFGAAVGPADSDDTFGGAAGTDGVDGAGVVGAASASNGTRSSPHAANSIFRRYNDNKAGDTASSNVRAISKGSQKLRRNQERKRNKTRVQPYRGRKQQIAYYRRKKSAKKNQKQIIQKLEISQLRNIRRTFKQLRQKLRKCKQKPIKIRVA